MRGTWPYAGVVAHRGGGSLAPENTLAAFETGARFGFKLAECDVKLSGDGVLFLLHDDTIDRTSNGHGAAANLPYNEIAGFDAGSWLDAKFAGERMPTLTDLAQTLKRLDMGVNLEIKPSLGHDAQTGTSVAIEAARLWLGRTPPLLSSFSEDALGAARNAVPDLPRGLLVTKVPPDWRDRTRRLECEAIHVAHTHLDAEVVRAFKDAGLFVMAYTVNDLSRARSLAEWGVDAICTDRIDKIGPAWNDLT
ncbi:MAG TPA: glycerophosphodiester phosphodiesterase [Candidatus Baltobacteraceae bacterium]